MLRKGGRLVWFGVAASKKHGARVIPSSVVTRFGLAAIPDGKRVMSIPDIHKDHARYRATLTSLLDHLAAGKLRPVVAERLPLGRAARAHEMVERGGHRGKVVLVTARGD
jgi:NADPH:quinone reductase-like Zn-dependent oxidoreductase